MALEVTNIVDDAFGPVYFGYPFKKSPIDSSEIVEMLFSRNVQSVANGPLLSGNGIPSRVVDSQGIKQRFAFDFYESVALFFDFALERIV